MCGISGFIAGPPGETNSALLDALCQSIFHRGPDDKGTYINGNFHLGMRRLSIVDLKMGRQPFHSPCNRVHLIFNGEIYNFAALRSLLENKYQFTSRSDGEVILAGYCLEGKSFFAKLNGIYAFAIVDERSRTLMIGRDPNGVKPLYYLSQNGFYFSSELKSFAVTDLQTKIDIESVWQYLHSGYVFRPKTALAGVRQVEPGELLVVDENYEVKSEIFSSPHSYQFDKFADFQTSKAAFETSLTAAIAGQTIGDVDFGVLLSSGLDSMYIAAVLEGLAKKNQIRPFKTFTATFDTDSFNEESLVRHALRKSEYISSEFFKIESTDLIDDFEDLTTTFCNLEFLPTCYNIYKISQNAAKSVKFVLSGAGGDELFYGYPTYPATALHQSTRFFTKSKSFNHFISQLLPATDSYLSLSEKVKRFLAAAHLDTETAHLSWRQIWTSAQLENLTSKTLSDGELTESAQAIYKQAITLGFRGFEKYSFIDMRSWLIDCGLMMWDKAGMRFSLEIRVPFIDDNVMRVYSSTNHKHLMQRLGHKSFFRQIARNIVDPKILSRPKQGFQAPLNSWLKNRRLTDKLYEYTKLLPNDLFSQKEINRVYSGICSGNMEFGLHFWLLACLAAWQKNLNLKW